MFSICTASAQLNGTRPCNPDEPSHVFGEETVKTEEWVSHYAAEGERIEGRGRE